MEFLADFDVAIIHRPGRENIADSLSRLDHSDVECSREGPEKMFDSAQASKPESFQTADVTMSEPDGQLWNSEVSILLGQTGNNNLSKTTPRIERCSI